MSLTYVVIGFEDRQVTDVERALCFEFGDDTLRIPPFGIHLSVANYADEYKKADSFLQQHGLVESNPFLQEFDILPFSTEIHLECMRGRLVSGILEIVADMLAVTLAKHLNTRALGVTSRMIIYREGVMLCLKPGAFSRRYSVRPSEVSLHADSSS
ncbi:hypothetical protein [Methylocaldum szegediense]|uniref:hypothetical protein n=1 Tax=Methylocaldum szegediense TaxID=73780 RepID=UPI0012EC29F8|nr:hypothetical protein [Methylocaldum szegediense]